MKKWICAKDVTSLAVIELMHGKKTKVAVKTENGFCFFGGTSKGVEKKSKTKIRSVATALQELIENADQIFLMGHRFGDLDAIGSACPHSRCR